MVVEPSAASLTVAVRRPSSCSARSVSVTLAGSPSATRSTTAGGAAGAVVVPDAASWQAASAGPAPIRSAAPYARTPFMVLLRGLCARPLPRPAIRPRLLPAAYGATPDGHGQRRLRILAACRTAGRAEGSRTGGAGSR